MTTLAFAGCAVYKLVPAEATYVGGNALIVTPTAAWNEVPARTDQTQWEEIWTRNGPLLDTVAFVGGIPDGKKLLVQKRKSDQQVPAFRADMSPQDLVSMIEASYRVRGITVFDVESVDPVDFLGGKGVKMRYRYAPNDGIAKKGSCVARVIGKKLYLMKLEGVSSHYFDAVLPEFEQMVATAKIEK
jgi:hypothetical protein